MAKAHVDTSQDGREAFGSKQKEKIENDNSEALWVPGNQKLKGQL